MEQLKHSKHFHKSIKTTTITYLIVTVLPIIILSFVMQLWQADLRVPFAYDGDVISMSTWIKGVIDNGWYLHNDYVGAPFGLDLQDYPLVDSFNFLLIKIISILFPDYAIVLNLFYILTYVLITATAFFVFREFKISVFISIVFALLYAFQPYHFGRSILHLFLSSYYMIPLITLVILWIWYDESIFFVKSEKTGTFKFNLARRIPLLTITWCLITGSTGVYYAFFSCFFALVAGLSAFFQKKNQRSLISSLIVITLICSSVFFNIVPSLVYNYNHGSNPSFGQRSPIEADEYGLKAVHLLLPSNNHRIPQIRSFKQKYISAFPLNSENTLASLGIVGSFGFLFLLIIPVLNIKYNQFQKKIDLNNLAALNLSGLLFASIGGLGTFFNILISPQIRAYNRISIFIAFFSLLCVALIFENWRRQCIHKKKHQKKSKAYLSLILIATLVLGILDQTPTGFTYDAISTDYWQDKSFVKAIEKNLPANSMIFQLPYVPFPENPGVYQMNDYELFKGYLHSKKLRWSYGAMRGRHGDWHEWVSSQTLDEMLTAISAVGFKGIYIDGKGYPDGAEQLKNQLKKRLNVEPINSENQKIFFDLKKLNALYKSKYSAQEIENHKQILLNTLKVEWLDGFSGMEGDSSLNWHWASNKAKLLIDNPSNRPKDVTFNMSFATGWAEKSHIKIESDLFSDNLDVNMEAFPFTKKISVPPGKHIIKFTSDAKQVNAPGDPRKLFFRINNFKIIDQDEVLIKKVSKDLSLSMREQK